jgi:uncharacterized membrane protein YdfJ with MMPL/SSD domain
MSTFSHHIHMTRRRSLAVIAVWLAIVVAAIPFAVRESDHLTAGGFAVPGSQSSRVETAMARRFPTINRASLGALIWPRAGATAGEVTRAITRLGHAVRGISGVSVSQHDLNFGLFAAGLTEPVFVSLKLDANSGRAQDIADILRRRLGLNRAVPGRVETHLLGESGLSAGLQDTFKRDLASAEKIGLPIVFVVLLAVFGSFSAAILPIVLGAVAVSVTGAIIYFISLVTEMSLFVTNTASMLGIGVAIDYSLIILSRVRQELQAGQELGDACKIALSTSGRAVIFSGVSVMAALAGLWLVPIDALHSMAAGALVVVAVSVIVSVTLLPALIIVLGTRRVAGQALREGVGRLIRPRGARRRSLTWDTWTRTVMDHPIRSLLLTGGALVALCTPVLALKTGTGTLQQLSPTSETRLGYIEAAKLGGVGALGPADVVVHADGAATPRLAHIVGRLRDLARGLSSVREVGSPHLTSDGYALFTVVPTVDPESRAAEDLVQQLRRRLSVALRGSGVSVSTGGTSATQLDLQHAVTASMWKVIAAVMGLMFLALMMLLRSVLLPVKAVVMSLLSVGAAYGVLVIVFQWGWLDPIAHYHSLGYLDTLTLPLILAIVVGLSMDYEVFLLCRIKERWMALGDPALAVASGLRASANTISSAAVVLICVFAVFVGTGIPSVKELGLGVAVAIFLDATLIRLILVPAVMRLLSSWSWWWPVRLERVLPSGQARPLRAPPQLEGKGYV